MNRKILLGILLLAFVGYAGWSFMDAVTPYVGIAEARRSTSNVQVKGLLAAGAPAPHMEGNLFVFTLQDEETGETMVVHYHGTKPDQFDEAYHVVAIGKYQDTAFEAHKLLIKCPSKYEQQKR
ncbi:MAG: cytochrome c maturation protein CcmE [Selenomonas sp.]|jgi:cytochrome c-type biogenesis protein CcmE|uniref:cytochrome c maturation protein CcmE domain-containing protein n=1 Tax=Selenomonas sp. AE3005 TaxID=1485543 RepID=UPI0004878ABF|nr:cytochrome c maturation protein CcmE [Selenomonas sp. AE3005]MBQ1461557.1 cytochrome c maturation protein CcmE [Selenomonas sp.]MBQ1615332.1 cytochrome c maturation protein CcmE [Selenomonas sp.]MBQ1919588.1 cytochrome c maturation protein CcmE [Selenomonas sp.]MBQ4212074.1 cytochrome c maturation protein CcmE [Selenomonas sp.]MBQ5419541.1 cytochrome c maturation protein CcmE [Selenomonas sp.]